MPHSLAEAAVTARRTYVLDTNVLLYDPNALHVFEEHDLVIPFTVIEEIDRFKKDLNETGRNARMTSRRLDKLRKQGSLSDGVALDGGGTLRVVMPPREQRVPEHYGGGKSNDNLILSTAMMLADDSAQPPVVMVTRDTNMRIKSDALGLTTEDYEHAHVALDERFSGVSTLDLPPEQISAVYQQGWIEFDPLSGELPVYPNQFLVLRNVQDPKNTALVRFEPFQGRMRLVQRFNEGIWGISPRNKEQRFALDLLLDDRLSLVTLDGMAGTGKTLLAIACGLRLAADEQRYRRLVVSRPIFPMGRDLGFLPGDVSEKLNPWMKPIFDNLDLLVGTQDSERGKQRTPGYQALLDQGIIEVEPLTYIRGRSLPQQYLVVDEAQNLTPHEVKTVLTRAGEGTKIVLTGDPQQIDNPYVDATSNGLTYVIERFKDVPEAGHITLTKGERSRLAELAAKLL